MSADDLYAWCLLFCAGLLIATAAFWAGVLWMIGTLT